MEGAWRVQCRGESLCAWRDPGESGDCGQWRNRSRRDRDWVHNRYPPRESPQGSVDTGKCQTRPAGFDGTLIPSKAICF